MKKINKMPTQIALTIIKIKYLQITNCFNHDNQIIHIYLE